MSKSYDVINHRTVEAEPLPPLEQAQRNIRSIQRRINNPDMRDDCRQLARVELRRWRRLLVAAAMGKQLKNQL